MKSRRMFLKQAATAAILSPCLAGNLNSSPATLSGEDASAAEAHGVHGFRPHLLRQGNGSGGWSLRPAEIQFVDWGDGTIPYTSDKFKYVIPFGVVQMDNGVLVMVASVHDGEPEPPAIAFSHDRGNSWTQFEMIPNVKGRPMMLTYLGEGNLTFQPDNNAFICFSSDYGRTWPDRVPLAKASDGESFSVEGNALVDRDAHGQATKIAEIGYNYPHGTKWPKDPATGILRWSDDGGRTWGNETVPAAWRWEEEYQGKSYTRSISEGSLVRAANGWLVAALRTDMHPQYFEHPSDNSEGTGISISKDNGVSWSAIKRLYDAGRMHAHLLRMPNGDLVMTYIMRDDIENGELASYNRGCEALVSHDHGLTWDMSRKYILDQFEFSDGTRYALTCGHIYSALLDDGHILTCYGRYTAKGACLVRWKP